MPYDPNFPIDGTTAEAPLMRAQLNSIVDLIHTIPVGPAGPQGVPGDSVNGAVIDGVTTGNAGDNASATVGLTAGTLHFTFDIPRGDVGEQGSTGLTGADGATGATGPMGAPFTSFVVDSVTTLGSSEPATVSATFDGTFVRFAFAIPQGQQGATGGPGADGATGPQGPQGNAGEVSPEHLAEAIAGTPSNTNPIATLDIGISDPPTQTELQQVQAKLNELIVGLQR